MNAPHRRTRSWAAAALAATTWVMVSAGPVWADAATPVNPDATNANAIDQIYRATLGVCVTIFVLVGGWLVYTAIRFRAGRGVDAPEPPQFHGSTRLEVGWTLVPLLILAALAGYTLDKIPTAENIGGRGQIQIGVLAQQFSFTYTYPNGKHPKDPSTLVVPVDTPIVIDLRSKDVAHDFWVPALGPKVDAIPGQLNRTGFTADHLGTFEGGCAELCGIGHAGMLITVQVVSKPDFQTYMAKLK